MCCVAKVYSTILNNRLQKYLEANEILVDEQNGFRSCRSCIDHIFSLVTILRNRKALGLSTFLSFIDFKKAFDSVDRNFLLFKLSEIGVVGNFYNAIDAIYKSPSARVILNDYSTDYFDCPLGVKQGDTISPTLFSIFINDLAKELKNSNLGVSLDENLVVSTLLYADDIVLLADNEDNLQSLLDITEGWCKKWRLEVNLTKTNILHVRKQSLVQSEYIFHLGDKRVEYCHDYKYLGICLNEFLGFDFSAGILAESAGRALGATITKMIKNGGFPLNVYKKLYDSSVCSVSDYGGEIWGFKEYEVTRKIHLRAIRAFMGIPKKTPIPGVLAEMNWLDPRSRSQIRMIRHFKRLTKLPDHRLTKKVFLWDRLLNDSGRVKTWSHEIKEILIRNNMDYIYTSPYFSIKETVLDLQKSLLEKDKTKWEAD